MKRGDFLDSLMSFLSLSKPSPGEPTHRVFVARHAGRRAVGGRTPFLPVMGVAGKRREARRELFSSRGRRYIGRGKPRGQRPPTPPLYCAGLPCAS